MTLVALLVCLLAIVVAQPDAVAAESLLAGPRLQVCLNGEWLRHVGQDVSSLPQDGWEVVRVPEPALAAAKGSAWFRLDFAVPAEFARPGQRTLLRFVRVRHYARVFVNGEECGENFGMRAPFEVDVTDAVRPGEANRVDVWVHQCSGEYATPGGAVQDIEAEKRLSTFEGYRNHATIAEDVFLISRPALHVSEAFAMPSVRRKSLTVRLTVTNDSDTVRTAALANRVFLGDQVVLDLPDRSVEVAAGASETLTVTAPWADPQLWGYPPYGEPVLHHLETRVSEGEGVTDRLVTRFGFRELWTEGTDIILNGEPIKVLGYWVPEGSGRSQWTLRMAAVQAAGCNAIHNHAEQREPAFYDVADELGILVWDADFCGGPLGSATEIKNEPYPELLDELKRQYPMWARAVANHPSVGLMMVECILWWEASPQLGEVYLSHDPTRLIHAGGGVMKPMHLGAYASNFELGDEGDPLRNIKQTYGWSEQYLNHEGVTRPLINKEIWYKYDWRNPPDPERIAEATADCIDFLREQDLAGLILYSQQAYNAQPIRAGAPDWPSRSGEGQHHEGVRMGGHPWGPADFVNLADPSRPAVDELPTAQAMREASGRYLGHKVPVASTRRPEAVVALVVNGESVADAYVFAAPIGGVIGAPVGMRTDARGTAWFQLRDPGRYSFTAMVHGKRIGAEVDAPLQPLDLSKGGLGNILRVRLEMKTAAAD